MPGPKIGTHLSREASRERYAPGTDLIGSISMVANTGPYIDVPFLRFPEGVDLIDLPASSVTDVPGVVVRVAGRRSVDVDALADVEVRHRAVLFHTGWDRHSAPTPTRSGRHSSPRPPLGGSSRRARPWWASTA